jgi:hypothetical protein
MARKIAVFYSQAQRGTSPICGRHRAGAAGRTADAPEAGWHEKRMGEAGAATGAISAFSFPAADAPMIIVMVPVRAATPSMQLR